MYIAPLILQVILIGLNAIFASAEIAVISMNDTKLQHLAKTGDVRARRLAHLTQQPAKFLATIQVAITLAGLLGSAFAAENFAGVIVDALRATGISERLLKSLAVFGITLILAYFNLVFGELVPKRVAMKRAEGMALGMSGMLLAVSRFFAPLVWLLTASTNAVLRLLGIDPQDEEEVVSEEEIYMMLEVGNEKGTIDREETQLIRNVFAFDDISVERICTHRVDVAMLGIEESMEEWHRRIQESRFTYYPIYGEDPDDVLGILNTKKYFRLQEKSRESIMQSAVEEPYFVPEIMKADVLFRNMKRQGQQFAVVLDEYGGLSGVLSLLDLLEPLVGDIFAAEGGDILPLEQKHTWRILGNTALADVAQRLEISLPTEEYDTFGGYLFGVLGYIPPDGAKFTLETEKLWIRVERVENHRIVDTVVGYRGEGRPEQPENAI